MPSSTDAKRYGHVAARLLAVVGGILLGTTAAFSYFIAGYADDAVEAGTDAAEGALRDGSTGIDQGTADQAADWFHRLSDWYVDGRPDNFRNYCLVAIAAALIAMLVALVRRPDSIWPEIVWGAAALAGLAPNLAFDFWFGLWAFTGSVIAAAAVVHYWPGATTKCAGRPRRPGARAPRRRRTWARRSPAARARRATPTARPAAADRLRRGG
jgi:hypothetical protein